MSRSVYNIDFDAFVDNGHILGEDGDAALALNVIVVQDQLPEIFRLAYKVCLINHSVDECSLAVVDMGDDRYVSYFLHNSLQLNPRT